MIGFPAVTVYTQPDCRPCERVKSKLNAAGIEYEAVDISADNDARNYVINVLKAKSTPVIVSDVMDPILGYQPDKLKDLILLVNADKIYDALYDLGD